jgi:hypothetical protein
VQVLCACNPPAPTTTHPPSRRLQARVCVGGLSRAARLSRRALRASAAKRARPVLSGRLQPDPSKCPPSRGTLFTHALTWTSATHETQFTRFTQLNYATVTWVIQLYACYACKYDATNLRNLLGLRSLRTRPGLRMLLFIYGSQFCIILNLTWVTHAT